MSVPVSELQQIAPSSIIELFELQLNVTQHGTNDLYRFHAGTSMVNNGELVWNGNSYLRFPIQAEGFEYSGKGTLPRPVIRCSNILGTITSILVGLPSGLEGAKVTRIRTMARYIDGANFPGGTNPYGTPDPTAEFPREVYYIDRKSAETRDVVEFELAAAFDLAGVRAPRRQCIANICQWTYRSAECTYSIAEYYDANDNPVATSAADVCGKRLSSCEVRFKAFTRQGSVTQNSDLLTLTTSVNVAAGTPVAGFGVPVNTYVISVSGSGLAVTMSSIATATSSVTTTGTIQNNRTQLIVASATGLAKGMTVTGPNIPAGTTITGIAGTTLTLSQQATPVLTLFASRNGRLVGTFLSQTTNQLQVDTTNLAVGMIVMGANLPTNYSVTITGLGLQFGQPVANLSYQANKALNLSTYNFYTVSAFTSQTYTFAGGTTYTFRNPANDALPFGSFPGVGTYFT